ncbi:MAG: SRPBCC domain-containing protein, partial [Bacteroidia bacterium]
MKTNNNVADREIKISRLLNAPVELVWKVWTEPGHIANWWGPIGFT